MVALASGQNLSATYKTVDQIKEREFQTKSYFRLTPMPYHYMLSVYLDLHIIGPFWVYLERSSITFFTESN